MRVLVVGATGLLGAPVAKRLSADGHHVRLLVRDAPRARRTFPTPYELIEGSVTDDSAIAAAVDGMDAVHISLSGATPADMDRVEGQGVQRLARTAARAGVQRISYLTGALVRVDYGPKIPEHRAKLHAELAIEDSGVPYTFFRPTYFIDNLPRHVQGPVAVVLGRQRRVLHPVAAVDYARLVARALDLAEAARAEFAVHGPEPTTLTAALHLYCRTFEPAKRVVTVPITMMRAVDTAFLKGRLRGQLQIMQLLERLGEVGDATRTAAVLGATTTTVEAWCRDQALSRHPRLRAASSARRPE